MNGWKFLSLCVLLAGATAAPAEVVRKAPDVLWIDSAGKSRGLSAFKGQPIVIVIAPSPRDWKFRSQVGQLQRMYERYAAGKVVFLAAFSQEPGRARSNIPFAVAADGPQVAHAYEAGDKFAIAVIGRDGNLDYVTDRVLSAQRVFDVIGNSFVQQERLRRP